MTIERTRHVIHTYFKSEHSDVSMMAVDVVFTNMADGTETVGPAAVQQMLAYFYRIAFDATAEPRNLIFADKHAVWEGEFVGKHIGEFAGLPPTGRQVRVPLCVVYDIVGDKLQRARIYLAMSVMMKQLGVEV